MWTGKNRAIVEIEVKCERVVEWSYNDFLLE
jgi:hypothetical protein